MPFLDLTIPGWIGQAAMTVAGMGVGGYLWEIYKRKYPTRKERVDTDKAESEFFGEKFSLGLTVYNQLTKNVELLVEQKTKHFSEMMFKKEMAHLDEIKQWETKMSEANQKISLLEKRIEELEKDKYNI